MSSVSVPIGSGKHPNMRPMSMFRDLPAVADLIELCFADSMDRDGQRYINDMRRASRDNSFLKWASGMTETASLPLTGFVWEEDERIIDNASVIPFRDKGRKIYLIANIAVHPDYRRRGIGRILTQRAMQHGWDNLLAPRNGTVHLEVTQSFPCPLCVGGEAGATLPVEGNPRFCLICHIISS